MRKCVVCFAEVFGFLSHELAASRKSRRLVAIVCGAPAFVFCLVAWLGNAGLIGAATNEVVSPGKGTSASAPILGVSVNPADPLCAITNGAVRAGTVATNYNQSPGTLRMVERLRRITRQPPPDNVPYLNAER